MSQDDNQGNVTNLNEHTNSPPVRPVVSFSGSGGLDVAVWKQKGESEFDHYSVRIDRSYKQEDGNYKTTSYLRESDLLRVGKLLEQADDWIEQDRAKQRSANAAGRSR
ncbi:MAG TPA: hypothetical protein VM260_01515 [Pirellula sp.]|nr:hypothetical protein [Pirellula sp.]